MVRQRMWNQCNEVIDGGKVSGQRTVTNAFNWYQWTARLLRFALPLAGSHTDNAPHRKRFHKSFYCSCSIVRSWRSLRTEHVNWSRKAHRNVNNILISRFKCFLWILICKTRLAFHYHLWLSVKNAFFRRRRLDFRPDSRSTISFSFLLSSSHPPSDSYNRTVRRFCLSSAFGDERCGNLISFLTCCNNTQHTERQQKLDHFYFFFFFFSLRFPF